MDVEFKDVVKKDSQIALYNDDCLNVLPTLKDKSVDLILCDLPYGVTNNKWDSVIPLDFLWEQYKRLIKDRGVIVLTAAQPFTSILVVSNLEMFKYDIVWEKTIASNQLNVAHQPLRIHESILLFYNSPATYNEQLSIGKPYKITRKAEYKNESYGKQASSEKDNTGFRHATSVIKISNPRIKGGHPTQKPDELLRYLIKTYSNPSDLVLDNAMGSGSTGVAAIAESRRFIGIELDETYYSGAEKYIKNIVRKMEAE
jgi:site-specific DNA-methyltransferase (adenine-specific)